MILRDVLGIDGLRRDIAPNFEQELKELRLSCPCEAEFVKEGEEGNVIVWAWSPSWSVILQVHKYGGAWMWMLKYREWYGDPLSKPGSAKGMGQQGLKYPAFLDAWRKFTETVKELS